MSKLQIGIQSGKTCFSPGEKIQGAVLWELSAPPKSAELKLIWFTRGKGTEEVGVMAARNFEQPQAGDTRQYMFSLPVAPYSFSGKLISLIWALELVIKPGKQFKRLEFTMAPNGREILLPTGLEPERSKFSFKRSKT